MAIATREQKQQAITALQKMNTKYQKPFEKGQMATLSFMGGNWESYATVVMGMVTADTLLDIDAKLERLNYNLGEVIKLMRSSLPSESSPEGS